MYYSDVIKDNCDNNCSVAWWPKFAYHYTDVTNAVSILNSGFLYSRVNAESMKLMQNNNASRQVIDMTQTAAVANVRFYFRPLTPTQYYNEGFKHADLRYDHDNDANVPVPVFFLFDLEKLLKMHDTRFSEVAQSGYGGELLSGEEEFEKLDFSKIYSTGPLIEADTKKYRHAELLYPHAFDIDKDNCLQAILCRNSIEKTTLLNLLKEKNPKQYFKYKSIVKICRENMFESNGLYVTECKYHDNKISVSLSQTSAKVSYTRRQMKRCGVETLTPINARAEFDWISSKGILHHTVTDFKLQYNDINLLTFSKLIKPKEAKNIRIKLFFDDKLMCYFEQSLSEIELI